MTESLKVESVRSKVSKGLKGVKLWPFFGLNEFLGE